MTKRSKAREVAMQLLFQKDFNKNTQRAEVERFVGDRLRDKSLIPFALQLYDGVLGKLEEIDKGLSAAADNWKLHRMAGVDRNVLRLGSYEMLHLSDSTPAPVALDEAIELARRFGSQDSPSFVNGVLDKIHKTQGTGIEAPQPTESAPAETPAVPPAPAAE
ncbi:transcription antitermination factor NusB [Telmatocola sphagniphila]|uniref:Transcription antitermination protein NusB n=1 Tax=Telmatocola sphagniphila TaxID=1123043 RepID=A0A8E6B4M7_9BACT|nr:transcription antitermination factor NusB [Telmatocola sphagniphila]QVL31041.1 transcription antitermination factor NusB [Telmatocola sphagniphila]